MINCDTPYTGKMVPNDIVTWILLTLVAGYSDASALANLLAEFMNSEYTVEQARHDLRFINRKINKGGLL
tara:strand:+ start:1064 stop:1273 length:210 start_codon:yes stop_codon:yes gene_type:complete